MPDWFPKRLSKKLVAFLLTALTIALNKKLGLGLDSTDVAGIAAAGGAYVLGQGAVDFAKERKG